MIPKINLLLQRINWEYVVLYCFYASCILIAITGYNVVRSEFQAAEEFCTEKKGVLIQDKVGEFYCIKSKSVIKLDDESKTRQFAP
jgi:hypothetical protein